MVNPVLIGTYSIDIDMINYFTWHASCPYDSCELECTSCVGIPDVTHTYYTVAK